MRRDEREFITFQSLNRYTSLIKRGGVTIFHNDQKQNILSAMSHQLMLVWYVLYLRMTHAASYGHTCQCRLCVCARVYSLEFKPVENRIKFFATEFLSLWDLQWIYLIDSCRKRRNMNNNNNSKQQQQATKERKFSASAAAVIIAMAHSTAAVAAAAALECNLMYSTMN